jgi:glucose/arabinose dehydrogenase
MRRARLALIAAGSALLVAGCTSAAGRTAPTWVPSPGNPSEGPGVSISPIVPLPSAPSGSGSSGGGASGGSSSQPPSSSSSGKTDPLVVATHLDSPVGLAMLPDGTALVGERRSGRIVKVQPKPGQPVPTVKTIAGVDGSGDGGLLDLALSPTFDQDGLIYAYLTTKTDNRVVDFTLDGPVTPVLTGIPKGSTGNAGRLLFGDDGDLYVGTGDAGHPDEATSGSSLAGKVLRVTDIGQPAAGNPTAGSSVWTSGHQGVDGLCSVTGAATQFEVEAGAGSGAPGEVNLLVRGGSYGYPAAGTGARAALTTLPKDSPVPGGCAVLAGRLWVTSLDGDELLDAAITGTGASARIGTFGTVLKNTYGRLRTVVAAPDGALWLTTSNKDGHGKPVAADERVIRYVPSGSSSKSGSPV